MSKRSPDGASKSSTIWHHSLLDNPTSKTTTCLVCKAAILRDGTSVANFYTSNLIKRLKTHHTKQHYETALPKLYETVREHISCRLKDLWLCWVCTLGGHSIAVKICLSKCGAASKQIPWVSYKGIIYSKIYKSCCCYSLNGSISLCEVLPEPGYTAMIAIIARPYRVSSIYSC